MKRSIMCLVLIFSLLSCVTAQTNIDSKLGVLLEEKQYYKANTEYQKINKKIKFIMNFYVITNE